VLVENIVLDQLESPLLFLNDDIGVILLDRHIEPEPSKLHEALLTQFAPHPLWVVYGAHYHSLHDLKMVLAYSITLAQKARSEAHSEYLLNIQTLGLESLLVDPGLNENLRSFATKLLTPLLEYDKSKGTDLTTTFVLAQTLGSVQAVGDVLGVHVNTIRYRLHKAEEILGIEEVSPKERISWGVASFIWMSFHPIEQMVSYSGNQAD
jgi:sugar diacid utilization regulator